jgi:hypothetical protein
LSLDGPTYHSEIHAAAIHDVDIPPPPITADILRLLHTDYMGHDRVDEALGELGDRSLMAEVARYRRLERKRKAFQDSITRIEDQLFTCDIERRMCVSRLEAARAIVTDLQGPPSGRTQSDKIRDLKSLAKQYARDLGSPDDTRISYLEFLETEAEDDLALARMIAG